MIPSRESAGEEESETSLDDAENGDDIEDSGDDSDDEDISAPKTSAYATLLQVFTKENGPAKKRRKLDHTTTDAKEETKQDDGSDEEENNDPVDADDVEEAEEGPETAVEGTMDDEDDEDDNTSKPDPFKEHFAEPDETVLSRRLKNLQESIWRTEKEMIPKVGKSLWSTPEHPRDSRVTTGLQCNRPSGLNLKKKLKDVVNRENHSFDELEERIAPLMFGYHDLLFCDRTLANAQKLRWLTCLHAVNHVFKYVPISLSQE